jgi:hypothetical protein
MSLFRIEFPGRSDPIVPTPKQAGRAGGLVIVVLLAGGACGEAERPDAPSSELTLREQAVAVGLEPIVGDPPRPGENPLNPERVELGHLLFFDPVMSGPGDVACSTCHLPRLGFADGRQFGVGAGGMELGPDRMLPEPPLRQMPRNSPTVLNAGLFGRGGTTPSVNGMMFWAGTAFGIEDQVLNPLTSDKEMRGLTFPKLIALDSVLARLREIPEYVDLFTAAYPEVAAVHGDNLDRSSPRRVRSTGISEVTTTRSPMPRSRVSRSSSGRRPVHSATRDRCSATSSSTSWEPLNREWGATPCPVTI